MFVQVSTLACLCEVSIPLNPIFSSVSFSLIPVIYTQVVKEAYPKMWDATG